MDPSEMDLSVHVQSCIKIVIGIFRTKNETTSGILKIRCTGSGVPLQVGRNNKILCIVKGFPLIPSEIRPFIFIIFLITEIPAAFGNDTALFQISHQAAKFIFGTLIIPAHGSRMIIAPGVIDLHDQVCFTAFWFSAAVQQQITEISRTVIHRKRKQIRTQ